MKKRKFTFVAVLLLLTMMLASCGAASAPTEDMYGGASFDKSMMETVPETTVAMNGDFLYSSSASGTLDTADGANPRKVISTCTIEAETKNFDAVISQIEESVRAQNGYIESSYVSGTSENRDGYRASRRANYTIRIPSSALEIYIASVESIVNITSKSENARDISSSYYDIQARLESLKVQEERLLEMLKQSKDLEYLLKLEDKLSEVRYNIESLTSTLKGYDNKVDYATVNINLREVVEYTAPVEEPITFGQRISDAFSESWSDFADGVKDFCVGLVYALPSLAIIAVLVIVVVVIIRNSIRRHRKNKDNQTGDNK